MTARPATLARLEDLEGLLAVGESVSEAARRCGWVCAASAAKTAGRLGRGSLARALWREAASDRRMRAQRAHLPTA